MYLMESIEKFQLIFSLAKLKGETITKSGKGIKISSKMWK